MLLYQNKQNKSKLSSGHLKGYGWDKENYIGFGFPTIYGTLGYFM